MSDLKFPADLKYAQSDEWVRVEGDTATIGISDFAQDALNDLVYIEFHEVGDEVEAGSPFGEVESVKTSSEVYAPIGGEIIEVNTALEDAPETVNADPYGAGWMIRIRITDDSALADLMDAEAYKTYCESR